MTRPSLTASLLLTAFVGTALFGFAPMTIGANIEGDCPLSAMATPDCPENTIMMAFHHLSAYYTFLNIPVASDLALTLFFSALALALVLFSRPPPLPRVPLLRFYDPPRSVFRRLLRRLALFELSPAAA